MNQFHNPFFMSYVPIFILYTWIYHEIDWFLYFFFMMPCKKPHDYELLIIIPALDKYPHSINTRSLRPCKKKYPRVLYEKIRYLQTKKDLVVLKPFCYFFTIMIWDE